MSDIFDELGGFSDGKSILDELSSSAPDKQVPPIAEIRNRAAAMALLSKGKAPAIETYQTTVKAINEGSDIQSTKLFGDIVDGSKSDSTKGLMSIMGSSDYSVEEKIRAAKAMKEDPFIHDTSIQLQSNALTADNTGENTKQESARLTAADAMVESLKARIDIQGLIQAHAASLDSSSGKAFGDFLASDIIPFGNNVIQARIAKAQGKSTWEVLKALVLAGSDASSTARAEINIPASQQVKFAKDTIDAISKSAGVVFPSDNHYAQYSKVQRMLSGEVPSTTETLMENVAPLLDLFGLRAEYKAGKLLLLERSINKEVDAYIKAIKGATPPRVEPTMPGTTPSTNVPVKSITGAPDQSLLSTIKSVPNADLAAKRTAITALEEQKAAILGDVNNAGKGDIKKLQAELDSLIKPTPTSASDYIDGVKAANPKMSAKAVKNEAKARADTTYKDSLADYEATKTRLEGLIETNRSSSTITQRVAELEKQIATLSKGVPDKAGSVISPLADAISRIEWNGIVRAESHVSPANIIGLANPSQGRVIFKSVVEATSEEASQALYGTSRQDAIVANVFPQASTEAGVVNTKVTNISKDLEMPESISDIVKQREGLEFTDKEINQATSRIENDFKSVEGLTVNDAMGGLSFDRNGGVISINSVYGTAEGGFNNAVEALDQVKFALKHYGIKDSNIELLAQEGITHKPVSLAEVANKEGNYFVRVKVDHDISMHDVGSPEWLDVNLNFADRFAALNWGDQGSMARVLVDAASMVHSVYSGAAVRASELISGLDKILLDEATKFTDALVKLPKDRQGMLQEYLKEANYNRLKFDPIDLTSRGFLPQEIDAVRKWRSFWDTHFYLENYDVVKTLDAQGYQKLVHSGGDELFAKPMNDSQWGKVSKYYDPTTGAIQHNSPAEMAKLKGANAAFAVLKRPQVLNGELVEHISVSNAPHEYLRKVTQSDQVLNKIDGYYSLTYKAPKFIDRITLDSQGNPLYRKAVAVAGDTREANAFKNRMITGGNEVYKVRDDARMMRTGDDDWWDTASASGRIAQRQRGKLLEDAQGTNHLGDGSYIVSPVDSAVRAARSIAGRTVGRPMLENAKERFMRQYKEYLPTNTYGDTKFPSKVGEIGSTGEFTSSQLADARTTWEYIRYLENGYINSGDTIVKAMFNIAANAAGKYGFSKVERKLAELGEGSPSSLAKNTVFNAYIASNFLRQFVVQPHQAMRTMAYNPMGWASGRIPGYTAGYLGKSLNPTMKLGTKNLDEFKKFVEDSHMLDGVDKQNLVRGSLEAAVDQSNKILRGVKKVTVEAPRIIGFDMGEKANQLTHLAAVFDMYKRKGLDLSDMRVRAKAYSEARAIGYDMNFAGDMPYNQNFASIALQFMQVPHKAILQATNRRLDPWTKTKLIAGDLVFWGVPSGIVYSAFGENLIPDPEVRANVVEGVESLLYNTALKDYYGSDKAVDLSSLAPYDMTGWIDLFHGITTTGADDIISNSPAGKLLGEKGRIQAATRMIGRYFRGFVDDKETPIQTMDALKEISKILSGVNNAYLAKQILDYHERRNAKGEVTEENVPTYMAVAQLFGLGSKSLTETIQLSKKLNEWNKDQEDNLRRVYDATRRIYGSIEPENFHDMEHYTRVTGRLLYPYRGNPMAQQKLMEWLKMDYMGQDYSMQIKLLKAAGIPDNADVRRIIERYDGITE